MKRAAVSNGDFEQISKEIFLININDAVELSYITSMLKEEKIPYRLVSEDMGLHLQIIHGRSFLGRSIYVRRCDYAQAMEIVKSYKTQIIPQRELEGTFTPLKRNISLFGIFILAYLIITITLFGYV